MRFTGLSDNGGSTYMEYLHPDGEAPYPSDIIVDQQGNIAYWANEYDPNRIIEKIAELIETTDLPDPRINTDTERSLVDLLAEPNPFATSIALSLESDRDHGSPSVSVFDVQGTQVASLRWKWENGLYRATWDGSAENGKNLPAGLYWVRGNIGTEEVRKKIVFLR